MIALLATLAWAGPPPKHDGWLGEPYWDRTVRLGGIVVEGTPVLQAIGGLEGGYKYRYGQPPFWTGRTRAALTVIYGVNTGSYGGGVAIGSFIGPDGKRVLLQTGPDVFFDGYGVRGSLRDYFLAWSPGVEWPVDVLFKVVDYSGLVVGARPGWVLADERRYRPGFGGVPIHTLSTYAAAQVRADALSFTLGYQRSWNGAGVVDGIILSGGL
jgi:hypothetical protein